MKKPFLLSLCIALATTMNAQKQSGGERNLEVQFAPFSEKPVSVGGIRFRKFSKDGTKAWRGTLMIEAFSVESIKRNADLTGATAIPELTADSSTLTFMIAPGFERHWKGTERLSPYWGAELAFVTATSEENEMFDDQNNAEQTFTETVKNETGYTGIGVNLIAGCDFYFAHHIYMGVEFGYGFASLSMKDIETTSTEPNAANIPNRKQGSGWLVGSNSNAQIRLGFLF